MELKEYLRQLQLSNEDKTYALSFANKTKYLTNDIPKAIGPAPGNTVIHSGYGNVNSSICIVYSRPEDVKRYDKLIKKMYEKAGYESWMPYVTFVNKGSCNDLTYLAMEISAVKPKVVFIFCGMEEFDSSLRDVFGNSTLIRIPDDATNVEDEASMVKAWKYFRKLINYKNKSYR